MSLALMNLVAVATIVCELMLICSGMETEQQVEAPLSRQLRDTLEDSIKLRAFIKLRQIDVPCETNPSVTGSSAECRDNEWLLDWDEWNLGERSPGYCDRSYRADCPRCYCVSPRSMEEFQSDSNIVSLISLQKLESDSAENMVITGLKFTLDKDRIIQLQMKEGKLLPDGRVGTSTDWKSPVDFAILTGSTSNSVNYAKLNFTKDVVMFDIDTRIIYLDKIILPTDYIVTGVKFSHFNREESEKGIRMEVKGTKYDGRFNLQHDTEEWFDSEDPIVRTDDSYNRSREEIPQTSCTPSTDTFNLVEVSNSNKQIRFRGSGKNSEVGEPIIPLFESESVVGVESRPLRGIELSYKAEVGHCGFIMLKFHDLVTSSHVRIVSPEELILIRNEMLKHHTTTIEPTSSDDSEETRSSSKQKGSAPKCYCQLIVVTILPILFVFW